MAYKAKNAVETFLGYVNKKSNEVQYIPDTSERGILLESVGEKVVIFVYPISHKADGSKNFFDTRDSGARERGVAWNYSIKNNLKYFCIAVHDEVDRYKNYIFSLESNESIVATVSGTIDGKRGGSGTQVVIPNDFDPKGDIERIKSRNDFFITAVRKDKFYEYINIFDNRPYTHGYDLDTLENNKIQDEEKEKKYLDEEYRKYLRNIKGLMEDIIDEYINVLRLNSLKNLSEHDSEVDIYKITDINAYKKVLKEISESGNFNEINEVNNGNLNESLIAFGDFLMWRCKPHQRIFFGAPGTGKSFKLNKEAKEHFGSNYERVTFHPNYLYGNFVGVFKPFPYFLKDSDGSILTDEYGNKKESITYKYVEGPFMRVLIKALKNPETNYLLLIEEINRANTAAVFGDFFQLLDRNIKGESEYPISTSEEVRMYLDVEFSDIDDEEIRKYIDSKIGNNYERLILPSNLYIWATMNSADQGVMPMDTAFKRRWDFEYIGIDEVLEDEEIAKKFEDYKFRITKDRIAKWNDFRVEVNKRLSDCRVSEDKLIGPYFISKSVLESGDVDKITQTIKNKVLMYLYEDAGKPYRNSIFLHEKSRTYSELCKNFDENGSGVFKISMDIDEEINTEEDKQTEDSLSEYKLKEDGMEGMVAEDNN